MEKVPRHSDKRSSGGIPGRLGQVAHGRNDARFDAPFHDHQISVKPIDNIGQLAFITQLSSGKIALDHNGTGCIFQRHQTLAQRTGRANAHLIRGQRFA